MHKTADTLSTSIFPMFFVVLAPILWGGNFVVGKAMEAELNPVMLNALRWSLAGLIVAPFAYASLRRDWRLIRQHLGALTAASLLGVVAFNSILYASLSMTTAVTAGLVFASTPFLIVAIGCLENRSAPAGREIAASGVSVTGVAIVLSHSGPTSETASSATGVWGGLAVLLSALIWALYCCALKRIPSGISIYASFLTQIVLGLLVLIPIALVFSAPSELADLGPVDWLGVGYLGVFASAVAFYAWQTAIAAIGPNRSGMFLNLIPIASLALSAIFLGEQLAPHHLLGGALIIASAMWLQRQPVRPNSR